MLKDIAQRRSNAPAQRTARPGRVPNLNVLPPRYRKAELTPNQKKLLYVCLLFLLLLAVHYNSRSDSINAGINKLTDKLAGRTNPDVVLADRLQQQLEAQQTALRTQRNATASLEARQVEWARILGILQQSATGGVTVTSIVQDRRTDISADLSGTAPDAAPVEEFRKRLEESPDIATATIKSLRRRPTGLTEFEVSITVVK
ncbi:MAG: hypothetical protein HYX97_06325 [Chloroflexi bacterium]|nr:hypothetical protein [Chloroflexota bacterium]